MHVLALPLLSNTSFICEETTSQQYYTNLVSDGNTKTWTSLQVIEVRKLCFLPQYRNPSRFNTVIAHFLHESRPWRTRRMKIKLKIIKLFNFSASATESLINWSESAKYVFRDSSCLSVVGVSIVFLDNTFYSPEENRSMYLLHSGLRRKMFFRIAHGLYTCTSHKFFFCSLTLAVIAINILFNTNFYFNSHALLDFSHNLPSFWFTCFTTVYTRHLVAHGSYADFILLVVKLRFTSVYQTIVTDASQRKSFFYICMA